MRVHGPWNGHRSRKSRAQRYARVGAPCSSSPPAARHATRQRRDLRFDELADHTPRAFVLRRTSFFHAPLPPSWYWTSTSVAPDAGRTSPHRLTFAPFLVTVSGRRNSSNAGFFLPSLVRSPDSKPL